MICGLARFLPSLLVIITCPALASDPADLTTLPDSDSAMISGDWAYGCDNLVNCRATSLGGEGEGEIVGGLRVTIDYAPLDGSGYAILTVRSSPAGNCLSAAGNCRNEEVVRLHVAGSDVPASVVSEQEAGNHDRINFRVSIAALRNILDFETLELVRADKVVADTVSFDGTLNTLSVLRGFGDCGSSQAFVWDRDTAEFVLVEKRTMPSCRAAAEWIVTFRRELRMQSATLEVKEPS